MLTNVARRLLNMLVTLLGVSIIVFLVLRLLPGNAVTASERELQAAAETRTVDDGNRRAGELFNPLE